MEKICPNCGKEFKLFNKHFQKYCCRECQIQYSTAHKKQVLRSIVRPLMNCHICGKRFKPRRAGAKFCSVECRKEAARLRAAEHFKKHGHTPTILSQSTCPVCGKTFKPNTARQIYCSQKCNRKNLKRNENIRDRKKFEFYTLRRGRPQYSKICIYCGIAFITTTAEAHFCSTECKKAAKLNPEKCKHPIIKHLPKSMAVQGKISICKYCGKSYAQPDWGTNPFCSGTCERAYYKKCGETLANTNSVAQELGLSYGQYMAYVSMGLNPADYARR